MDKELTKQNIQKLVEKYETIKKSGKLRTYSEEDTIQGFILPLFEMLGWDIRNKEEVSSQDHIKGSGRPDHTFKINGITQFYLESKKLNEDLDNEKFAFQTINYSWNTGVTYAILTDFEGLKVFNAQRIDKTELMDKLVFELSYDKYISDFETLFLLSKESLKIKELDVFAEKHGKKEKSVQVATVIKKINEDIQDCREWLTKEFKSWNDKLNLSKDVIDEGVQKLLDRLIFLRVAEDREVEPNILKNLLREAEKSKSYKPFQAMSVVFRDLDKIYNSNLFSPHPFENWEIVDDKGFENMINRLYGKKGQYEYNFKEMPADVLGTVYENYLNYKLTQSKKGVNVEKDVKKRKEQGIFYTPTFVVDYIVRNALKPVLDNCKSIADLKKIKVLDPACGSGSFLIRALEVIAEKYKEFGVDGSVKRQIILENLFGVDLDMQAVEIARLNLLINSLDSKEVLPKLDKNIKNGNSLISGTDEELKKQFGTDWKDKKSFNWQEEFPEVFKQGGFDVIIGNPPYINSIELGKTVGEEVKKFWREKFETAKGTYDIYILFFEQSLKICKKNGYVAFITPNKYLSAPYGESLRELITNYFTLEKILDLSQTKVFDSPSVYPIITIIKNIQPKEEYNFTTEKIISGNLENKLEFNINSKTLKMLPEYIWGVILSENIKLITKILQNSISLQNIAEVNATSTAGEADEFSKYINQDGVGLPIVNTGTIDRYSTTYGISSFKNKKEQIKNPFLDTSKINDRRKILYESPKIIVAKLGLRLEAFLDAKCKFASINTNCIHSPKKDYSLEYIVGILNSKIISFVYSEFFSGLRMGGGYFQFQAPQLRVLPITKVEKGEEKILEQLVNKMSGLTSELLLITENSNEWEKIKFEIEKTDKKIDEEVYRIYGLNEKEIKIVEVESN